MRDALSNPVGQPDSTEAPRRSTPRWVYVLALLVPIVWLERRVVRILASGDPAFQASFFVRSNVAEMVVIAACVAAWFAVHRYNEGASRKLSYLAVCATLIAVLNPLLVDRVVRLTGFPYVGRGDSEMRAFRAAAIAVAVGCVARARIARSRGALYGGAFATLAVAIGLAGVVLGIVIVLAFIGGMRGH
jgi:hypothetical protein